MAETGQGVHQDGWHSVLAVQSSSNRGHERALPPVPVAVLPFQVGHDDEVGPGEQVGGEPGLQVTRRNQLELSTGQTNSTRATCPGGDPGVVIPGRRSAFLYCQ